MIGELFAGWSWPTALITALILPVFIVIGVALRKALIKWSRYAVDGWLYILGRYITHQVASALTLRRYAALQLAGRSRELVVPAREDITLETDRVFIPLTLEGPLGEKRYDHTTVTQCGTRIRIIGEPGSGKTTVLKRLLRDECQKALRHARSARLPILYELKHLNPPEDIRTEDLGDWFLDLLKSDLKKTKVYNMEECVESYFSHAGVLLLLDGADEIKSSAYPRVEHAIKAIGHRLGQMCQKNIVIITMRTQFYQQTRHALSAEYPHVLQAKPFSPSDIYRFLSVWPFSRNANEQIVRIYADLVDRPTLRDMCTNPLVLAMYVAEDQLTGHPLVPETRSDFYARVTEELLIRRRAAQVGAPKGAFKTREDRERFLGQLAFEHILDDTQAPNLIRWENAVRIAREVYGCEPEQAEEIVREIALNTGLISEERANETLRFIHLTFYEFLAALYSVKGRRGGWQELLDAYERFSQQRSSVASSRLDQVIPFAAGLAPSYHAKADAVPDVRSLGNTRLLALVFLETKQYHHPEWFRFCKERFETLLSESGQYPSEAWLQELHLFAVVSKDFVASTSRGSASMPNEGPGLDVDGFFRQLANAGESALRRILSAYATRDPGAAFRIAALCNFDMVSDLPELIAENCDDPAILALAMQEARSTRNRTLEWAHVLAASALKSEVAAKALSQASLDGIWAQMVDAAEPAKRWDHILRKRSALSDVLTISATRSAPQVSLKEVAVFASFPAPKELLSERRINMVMGLTFLLVSIGLIGIAVVLFDLGQEETGESKIGAIVSVITAYALSGTSFIMSQYNRLFKDFLNLMRGDDAFARGAPSKGLVKGALLQGFSSRLAERIDLALTI